MKADPGPPGNDTLALSATVQAPQAAAAGGTDEAIRVSAPSAPVEVPSRIGRYAILHCLGQGAMGVVYSAYDPDLDRKVAVKLLRDNASGLSLGRQRMLQEAQAMARVSHPNVVHVYEVSEEPAARGGRVFLAMEFIRGQSLRKWQEQHPLHDGPSLDRRLRLYLQAALGLAAAHDSGLIHRDFKPDNVLVGEDGRVRVVDFGLARALDGSPDALLRSGGDHKDVESSRHSFRARLTQFGAIMGTPGYMSPEQVYGREADARSDQWSFCAALYEAIYGSPPFFGDTFEEIATKVLFGVLPAELPAPPRGVEVPTVLEQALRRGLAREPETRFASMRELIVALEAALGPDADSVASRRLKWSSIIAGPVLLSLLLFLAFLNRLPASPQNEVLINHRGVIVAWLVLAVYVVSLARVRTLIVKQPAYRRLAYFPVLVCSYLAVSRTAGWWYGITLSHFLLLESLGVIALLLSQVPLHGWRFLYPVAAAAAFVFLRALWPEVPKAYNSGYYALLGSLIAYAHIKASQSLAAATGTKGSAHA
jgi:serine/threonine-protein kinase